MIGAADEASGDTGSGGDERRPGESQEAGAPSRRADDQGGQTPLEEEQQERDEAHEQAEQADTPDEQPAQEQPAEEQPTEERPAQEAAPRRPRPAVAATAPW